MINKKYAKNKQKHEYNEEKINFLHFLLNTFSLFCEICMIINKKNIWKIKNILVYLYCLLV